MTPACTMTRLLGEYLDGELAPDRRRQVAEHLEECDRCARELADLDGVGSALRSAAAAQSLPDFSGLADGLLARTGAESAQSWRGIFQRGLEDARWAFVGGGSIAATFVSVLLVWMMVGQGTLRASSDSMAAQLRTMSSRSGTLMIVATVGGDTTDRPRVMLFGNGRGVEAYPFPARTPEEIAVLERLMPLVTRKFLTEWERQQADALVEAMHLARPLNPPANPAPGPLLVHEVHLVPDVVTVRGL